MSSCFPEVQRLWEEADEWTNNYRTAKETMREVQLCIRSGEDREKAEERATALAQR